MTRCECPLAGYCERHSMYKAGRLHELCQTDERYFEMWENKPRSPEPSPKAIAAKEWIKLVHDLWDEAHRHVPNERSPHWFKDWMNRIPSFGCDCQNHFKEILKAIPADFSSLDAWRKCTWMWHNSVRGRQGKPKFTWEEASKIHNWQ